MKSKLKINRLNRVSKINRLNRVLMILMAMMMILVSTPNMIIAGNDQTPITTESGESHYNTEESTIHNEESTIHNEESTIHNEKSVYDLEFEDYETHEPEGYEAHEPLLYPETTEYTEAFSSTLRIAVAPGNSNPGGVHGWYGNMADALNLMGIPFDTVTAMDLNDINIVRRYSIIMLDSGGARFEPSVLRQFMAEGGTVIATGLAGHNLSEAFPGMISFREFHDVEHIWQGYMAVRGHPIITHSRFAVFARRSVGHMYWAINLFGRTLIIDQIAPDADIYLSIGILDPESDYFNPSLILPFSASFRHGPGRAVFIPQGFAQEPSIAGLGDKEGINPRDYHRLNFLEWRQLLLYMIQAYGGLSPAPVITVEPVDQTVTANSIMSFTTFATGNPLPTYQWEVSTNNGASWTPIPWETYGSLTLLIRPDMNGNLYRCVITNAFGTVTTREARLTVGVVGSISAAPNRPDFGEHVVGYAQRPLQTITITNTGTQNVILHPLPSVPNWTLSPNPGWGALMIPGDTRSFTIRPNNGLPVGVYNPTIVITGTNNALVAVLPTFRVLPSDGITLSATQWSAPSFQGEGEFQQMAPITMSITVTTDQSWTATSDRDWLRVRQSGSSLTLEAEMNLNDFSRPAMVTVRAGTGLNAPSATIAVIQAPWQAPNPALYISANWHFQGRIGSIPFRFRDPTPDPIEITADIRTAWLWAVADWNSVPGVMFTQQPNDEAVNDLHVRQNVLLQRGRMNAHVTVITQAGAEAREEFSTFNAYINIARIGSEGWRSVAAHELTHVFGLHDRLGNETIMSYNRDRAELYRPTIHDIHGFRSRLPLLNS